MRVFFQLLRKELQALWFSPLTYAAWTVFLFLAGLNLWRMFAFGAAEQGLSQGSLMYGSVFFWIGVLALIMALTTPSLAGEFQSGTIETMLSAPLSDTVVALAKFFAAWLTLLIMILPTLSYLPMASIAGYGGDSVNYPVLASGLVMLAVVCAAYAAVGLFVSSLTRSQALAAGVTFPLLCILLFSENLLPLMPHPWLRAAAGAAAAAQHVSDAARGIMDSRPLVFYACMSAWFLFASVKALESRHWR